MGRKETPDKWTFFRALAAGLRAQPAYLLIFAIAALFFLVGLGSGIAGAIKNNSGMLFLAFGGLLASLIAAVTVVLRIEPPPAERREPASQQTSSPPSTGDPNFDDVLYAIHQNVHKALIFKNETFRDAVRYGCDTFRATTAEWSDGQIKASRHYNELLLKFYERATEKVLSTSVSDYLSAWQSSFGAQLLEAHKRSHATVTRVFLFDKRDEVTERAFEIMAEQSKAGINVLLFFGDENSDFEFLQGISKDFTIIDRGEAIGITLTFRGQNLAAQWYIEDQDQKGRFEHFSNSLVQASESFSKFEERYSHTKPGKV